MNSVLILLVVAVVACALYAGYDALRTHQYYTLDVDDWTCIEYKTHITMMSGAKGTLVPIPVQTCTVYRHN
jgi:hypothetical protein